MTTPCLFELREDSNRLTLDEERAVVLALKTILNKADRFPQWTEFQHMQSALLKKTRSLHKRSRSSGR